MRHKLVTYYGTQVTGGEDQSRYVRETSFCDKALTKDFHLKVLFTGTRYFGVILMPLFIMTQAQDPRMGRIRRDHNGSSAPTSLLKQCHPRSHGNLYKKKAVLNNWNSTKTKNQPTKKWTNAVFKCHHGVKCSSIFSLSFSCSHVHWEADSEPCQWGWHPESLFYQHSIVFQAVELNRIIDIELSFQFYRLILLLWLF